MGILPRKNMPLRPFVSNIDHLLIVVSLAEPELSTLQLDKYLILAEKEKIRPIIVFNKIDLSNGIELSKILELYRSIGYPCYGSSINEPNQKIISELYRKTTAITGPSGAGKSTLINSLFGFNLFSGEVSKKLKRGRQTTRHCEMLRFNDQSYIIDTPGFSSLNLEFIQSEKEIKFLFPEFSSSHCRFDDCMHISEPGCDVKDRVSTGDIYQSRYDSYQYFVEEFFKRRRK